MVNEPLVPAAGQANEGIKGFEVLDGAVSRLALPNGGPKLAPIPMGRLPSKRRSILSSYLEDQQPYLTWEKRRPHAVYPRG
jgi:hypothetical protein